MSANKRRSANSKRRMPKAVILTVADWKRWQNTCAELDELVHVARDLVHQLRDILVTKRRRSEAARKANETRQTIVDIRQPQQASPADGGKDGTP